jgi:hypothetical protein
MGLRGQLMRLPRGFTAPHGKPTPSPHTTAAGADLQKQQQAAPGSAALPAPGSSLEEDTVEALEVPGCLNVHNPAAFIDGLAAAVVRLGESCTCPFEKGGGVMLPLTALYSVCH